MESPNLDKFVTEFDVKGDNAVEKVQYAEQDKRVWINKSQYFGNVSKAVWDFQVGGYRVCDRWLKDRKGDKLSYAEIEHYQKIVVALIQTIRVIDEVETLIPRWPIT